MCAEPSHSAATLARKASALGASRPGSVQRRRPGSDPETVEQFAQSPSASVDPEEGEGERCRPDRTGQHREDERGRDQALRRLTGADAGGDLPGLVGPIAAEAERLRRRRRGGGQIAWADDNDPVMGSLESDRKVHRCDRRVHPAA